MLGFVPQPSLHFVLGVVSSQGQDMTDNVALLASLGSLLHSPRHLL